MPGPDLNHPVLNPPSQDETPPTSGSDFIYPFMPWNPGPGTQYSEGCSAHFRCSWDPKAFQDWATNSNHSATQLFWYVNLFHDHLKAAPIGFDANSGNFEQNGTVPAHDDVVVAQAQDGANLDPDGLPDHFHANNANMLVPPDGQDGLMQMYLWAPWKDSDLNALPNYRAVDGADDPSLVFHEYTHGLTGRLVTDAQGYGALNGAQAGAIDEGTADWYALDYLVEQGLFPDGPGPDVTMAPYEVVGPTGLRTQAIDCTVGAVDPQCPDSGGGGGPGGYTYGDFAKVLGGAEEHADGEIWAQTIWQLRQRLIQVHGPSDPGIQTDGVDRARTLLTDALRLAPPNPTFLDMRNAILLADTLKGLADHALIWQVFSQRGMGYAASTRGTDDVTPVPDITGPPGLSTPNREHERHGARQGHGRAPERSSGGVLGSRQRPGRGPLDAHVGQRHLSDRPHPGAHMGLRVRGAARRATTARCRRTHPDHRRPRPRPELHGAAELGVGLGRRRGQVVHRRELQHLRVRPLDGHRRDLTHGLEHGRPDQSPGLEGAGRGAPAADHAGRGAHRPHVGVRRSLDRRAERLLVQVSANASSWTTVAQGTFTSANNGHANTVTLRSQPAGVRYVKLRGLSTQQSSSPYMDVAELQVYAKPPAVNPPPPTACLAHLPAAAAGGEAEAAHPQGQDRQAPCLCLQGGRPQGRARHRARHDRDRPRLRRPHGHLRQGALPAQHHQGSRPRGGEGVEADPAPDQGPPDPGGRDHRGEGPEEGQGQAPP